MTVQFTRARHPELPSTVLPLAALGSYPQWEAYGEPSDDPSALRTAIAREPVPEPPQPGPQKPTRAASPVSAPVVAPEGAAPKE